MQAERKLPESGGDRDWRAIADYHRKESCDLKERLERTESRYRSALALVTSLRRELAALMQPGDAHDDVH